MMDGPTNGGYHELFLRQTSSTICVDHNKTGHILWKITKQDDGNYRIKIIDDDPTFGVDVQGGLYANAYVAVKDKPSEAVDPNAKGVDALLDPTPQRETARDMTGSSWRRRSMRSIALRRTC